MKFKTALVLSAIVLVVASAYYGFLFIENGGVTMDKEKQVYQGPVRPTDNEQHFRLTGETIPLEVEE